MPRSDHEGIGGRHVIIVKAGDLGAVKIRDLGFADKFDQGKEKSGIAVRGRAKGPSLGGLELPALRDQERARAVRRVGLFHRRDRRPAFFSLRGEPLIGLRIKNRNIGNNRQKGGHPFLEILRRRLVSEYNRGGMLDIERISSFDRNISGAGLLIFYRRPHPIRTAFGLKDFQAWNLAGEVFHRGGRKGYGIVF